jgi:hypothetical protein
VGEVETNQHMNSDQNETTRATVECRTHQDEDGMAEAEVGGTGTVIGNRFAKCKIFQRTTGHPGRIVGNTHGKIHGEAARSNNTCCNDASSHASSEQGRDGMRVNGTPSATVPMRL